MNADIFVDSFDFANKNQKKKPTRKFCSQKFRESLLKFTAGTRNHDLELLVDLFGDRLPAGDAVLRGPGDAAALRGPGDVAALRVAGEAVLPVAGDAVRLVAGDAVLLVAGDVAPAVVGADRMLDIRRGLVFSVDCSTGDSEMHS